MQKYFLIILFVAVIQIEAQCQENVVIPQLKVFVDGSEWGYFTPEKNEYTCYLPYSYGTTPTVTVESLPKYKIQCQQAKTIIGRKSGRTAEVTVFSPNMEKRIKYRLCFTRLPELELFLCIGQSNMAGRGPLKPEKGDLEVIPQVYLLNYRGFFEQAANPLNKYSSIKKWVQRQQMSPAYSFSKKIVEKTGKSVGLIVNVQGGSTIEQWEKEPGNKNDSLYECSIIRAKQALPWGKYRAILWHQGEGNSALTKVDAYMEQLKELVSNIRSDLGDSSLLFIAGELAYWRGNGTASTKFNKMIRTIGENIPNSDFISAEGCTPMKDTKDPHFSRDSQILLGERYADKVIAHTLKLK